MLGLILRNMGIQCFLNFGDICHISLKGYGILGPPPPLTGPQRCTSKKLQHLHGHSNIERNYLLQHTNLFGSGTLIRNFLCMLGTLIRKLSLDVRKKMFLHE